MVNRRLQNRLKKLKALIPDRPTPEEAHAAEMRSRARLRARAQPSLEEALRSGSAAQVEFFREFVNLPGEDSYTREELAATELHDEEVLTAWRGQQGISVRERVKAGLRLRGTQGSGKE